MLAYSLHISEPFVTNHISFSFVSLIESLNNRKNDVVKGLQHPDLLEYYSTLIEILTVDRPQGFLPGYQYIITKTCNGKRYFGYLLTSYKKECCCKEIACDYCNTVLGINCEVHNNIKFDVKCVHVN